MSSLSADTFTFDPRPNYPLRTVAKRYRFTGFDASQDPNAVTLIFAHATGYHKECWEPTLQHLAHNGRLKIREAWSIDCPNHGDAAILNEKELLWGYDQYFGWVSDYGFILHCFLTGYGTGVDVDFSKHRLVGIGHSMGAISILTTPTFQPKVKYQALILVDPMLMAAPFEHDMGNFLSKGAQVRRDIWPSKAHAHQAFASRPAFKSWDPEVLRLYVEYGLRPLPTAQYPDKIEGVTLTCTKKQEVACYEDFNGRKIAYRYLKHACLVQPVHIIYGAINDYLKKEVHQDVIDVAADGRLASVQRVAGAGHLVVQMAPKGLADAIALALTRKEPLSKL
ncbi:hypothetical protein JAAARDRAFT_34499 [Jaapia argillacea MUCL 33604]|uniref:AB hydrolase-1 domain-containing protein n=1 Tax=Jaapia argillacea MUCL 33604 TaxID=933084 RepID=A0A067PVB5_9AGAM|nr:hypothetical protein JAAARDRAFT_34499 [Jaapia argillacea MUCL 33604]